MRRVFLLVGLMLFGAGHVTAQTCNLANDVNGDGAFDIADPKYLLDYLFTGGPRPVCPGQTDANDDGVTDIADAVTMLGQVACNEAILGDVNGSGVLALADVDYLLEYLFLGGPAPVPCLAVADVNGDGDVNLVDATVLGGSLPCPGVVGDANGDEEVNIADMLVVGQSFVGGPGPVPCALAGDLNQDGLFTVADLIAYADLF